MQKQKGHFPQRHAKRAFDRPRGPEVLQQVRRHHRRRVQREKRQQLFTTHGSIGFLPSLIWGHNQAIHHELSFQDSFKENYIFTTEQCIELIPELYDLLKHFANVITTGEVMRSIQPEYFLYNMIRQFQLNYKETRSDIYVFHKDKPYNQFNQHMILSEPKTIFQGIIHIDFILTMDINSPHEKIMLHLVQAYRYYIGCNSPNDYRYVDLKPLEILARDIEEFKMVYLGEEDNYPDPQIFNQSLNDIQTAKNFIDSGALQALDMLVNEKPPSIEYFKQHEKMMHKAKKAERIDEYTEIVHKCIRAFLMIIESNVTFSDFYEITNTLNSKTFWSAKVYFPQFVNNMINQYNKELVDKREISIVLIAQPFKGKKKSKQQFEKFFKYMNEFCISFKDFAWAHQSVDNYKQWRP